MNLYTVAVYAFICHKSLFETIVPTYGFEIIPGKHILSNRTRSRWMLPLNIDDTLMRVGSSGTMHSVVANNNNDDYDRPASSSSPRGIVLNSAVGGLTFAGGLLGYVTKGSKASLLAGSIFGGLLLLAACLISKSSKNRSPKGNIIGSIVGGSLGYVMGKKFLVSKKFMPAGLLTILSAINAVYNLIEIKILTKTNPKSEIVEDAK